MTAEYFIAGDWGTSNFRLYLFQFDPSSQQSSLLEMRTGRGISEISNTHEASFESELFDLCDDWLKSHSIDAIILSGMVGSNIGWVAADYSNCPATAQTITSGLRQFSARDNVIHIVGGLSCTNSSGQFDVMRGEELQLLGWLLANQQQADTAPKLRLFGLPGTHNKWAIVQGSTIVNFQTSLTGELFGLLADHSVLLPKTEPAKRSAADDVNVSEENAAFDKAVNLVFSESKPDTLHSLFSTRALQLSAELAPADAKAYLSGLMIGGDVRSALASLAALPTADLAEIVLIGEPELCARYTRVLNKQGGYTLSQASSADVATLGYQSIYCELRKQH